MRGRLLGLLALVVVALAAPAATAQAVTIGIADQKPEMFRDPLFRDLGIKHARIAVPWNVLTVAWQREELDTWLLEARAAGVEPLVGFGHARGSRADRRRLPSVSRFKYEFRQIRARYPWVTTFATWNEANHCGEPTCHRAPLVAAYYKAMRAECPSCRVLAAEVLDMPNMETWVRQFERALGHPAGYWGLHNYLDANRRRTSGTKGLLRVTKGRIWFTETGGIVKRLNRSTITFPESAAHAKLATQFLFGRLVGLSGRIQRVYVYHWDDEPGPQTWDSALVNSLGQPRPALGTVAAQIRKYRLLGASGA